MNEQQYFDFAEPGRWWADYATETAVKRPDQDSGKLPVVTLPNEATDSVPIPF